MAEDREVVLKVENLSQYFKLGPGAVNKAKLDEKFQSLL